MTDTAKIKNLTPAEVKAMQQRGEIVLIDVREPREYGADRIHGALNYPLSTFDPAAMQLIDGRTVVFQCGSGKRSAMAVERCQAAGVTIAAHMAGGIGAWQAAGLPVITLDPATGQVVDRG
ncbi:MAG: rhodanese-like domain-containing protein [Caulobacter sp.]|nr:rhodanese-like domain-containing protein [Caulobacter sp.]